ncbi:MAG: hypothetical protein AAGK97_16235 [Bacteroidota bacterium]
MVRIFTFLIVLSFFSCVDEFEGELANNIFENSNEPFLEITNHETEVDLAEIFFANRINIDDFENIQGIVILQDGIQLGSIIEDANRTSFIRSNLVQTRRYCFQVAYLDVEDRLVAESEEYCFVF